MRLEAILWTLAAAYFAGIGALYVVLSGDPAGTTALLAAAACGGLVAGWLWHWNRHHAPRAEDRSDAEASDETGVVAAAPSASIRPLGVAVGMAATVLGVAVGLWLSILGVALLAAQVALLVRDADR